MHCKRGLEDGDDVLLTAYTCTELVIDEAIIETGLLVYSVMAQSKENLNDWMITSWWIHVCTRMGKRKND